MTTSIDSPPAFLYAPDFFKTNRIFTDGDQKIIRQHLDYAEANLLHVQKLKQDAIDEERIQGLSRRERVLVDGIERCRVALAPIKKLPDDVLQCIFTICCEYPTQFLLHDSKSILITLCRICCAWRSVALETPFLWSQIGLSYGHSFGHPFHENFSDVEEAVKLWFARASTSPISLEVDVGFHHSTSWERELRNLVERVIALPSRYRKLDLRISTKSMEVLLGKLSPYQLWHVEELQAIDPATFPGLVNSRCPDLPFSPATTFPNLKKLIVKCCWSSNNLSSLMPFPRLQTLNIIWITLPLALELFQQCPLLEICKIMIERSDSTICSRLAKRAPYITLPQLRDIEMSFDNTEDCCIFIDQLVLSNLQSLTIYASHKTMFHFCPNEVAEHLAALSQRSGTPNIRKLELHFSSVSVLNPGILLRCLPHLESIITSEVVILDKETSDGLAMGTLGPCLSELYAHDVKADLAAITKMVKQRAQNVELAQLQVLRSDLVLGEFGWNPLSRDDS